MSHAASNITMLATLPSFIKVHSMLISEEMRLDNAAKTATAMKLYSSTALPPVYSSSSCKAASSGSAPSSNNNRSKDKGNNKNNRNKVWMPPKGGSGFGSSSPSHLLPGVGPWICYNPATNTWATPGLGHSGRGILRLHPQLALTTTVAPVFQSAPASENTDSQSWDTLGLVATLSNLTVNGGWVVNSGTSAHMSFDDGTLSSTRVLSTPHYVTVGNGASMPITVSGQTFLHVPSGYSFVLNASCA
jgi:hypothetical protein